MDYYNLSNIQVPILNPEASNANLVNWSMHGESYLSRRHQSEVLEEAYESEVKRTSSSTTNSHNVAFLCSSSTNSATRAVNTAQGVNTSSTHGAVDSSTTVEKFSDVGNLQQDLKDKGVIDSGCSRHMIGNRSYLTDYKEIDERICCFEENSKMRENYWESVSRMYDKKNNVLFTDTACVVQSPDLKLTDENHVLLKVPRKDNMYSVDLKNVVPQGCLTCLFAKATPDESNLWALGGMDYVNSKK
ncbi:hypothetical protein Tco_0655950 [Tanacetum coccineum]|uniref:Retrovirus-related Pol polyprotein from transposon TNT 1-94-like beta-barrel domain-containing protein n=1 Tax=Tanacetum coccineum TaxID=301880 RepID=A0ABQ4X7E9_9ASTR